MKRSFDLFPFFFSPLLSWRDLQLNKLAAKWNRKDALSLTVWLAHYIFLGVNTQSLIQKRDLGISLW